MLSSSVIAVSITVAPVPVVTPPPPPSPPANKCKVPNVVGKTLAAAKGAIKKAHCRAGTVSYASSSKAKKGTVISQSRRAGEVYAPNTAIKLVVSRGNKRSAA